MIENLNDLCIGELSSVLYRQYQSYMNRQMKPYNINFAECAYLIKIPDHVSVTQTYIAEKLFCDNAMVTRSVKTLEKKGLVLSERSQEDKRAVLVSLTSAGRKAKTNCLQLRREWKEHIMAGISSEEEALYIQSLKSMTTCALSINHGEKMEEKE